MSKHETEFNTFRRKAEESARNNPEDKIALYLSGTTYKKNVFTIMVRRYSADSISDHEIGVITDEEYELYKRVIEIMERSLDGFQAH